MTDTAKLAGDRLPLIDTLRAFALFGVIVMNVSGMVMALAAAEVMPNARLPDYIAGLLELVLLQGKARSTFAFLFGVGFGLLMSRTGAGFSGFYLRRMTVLLIIGLINLTFFYWGDILILYALLGMVLILFRTWSDRALLTLGLILVIAPPLLVGLLEGAIGAPLRGINGQTAAEGWSAFAAQTPLYREGSWLDIARMNLGYYVRHPLFDTAYVVVYDLSVMGLFLLGLWTTRKGVLADVERHRPFLRRAFWTCLPVGLILSVGYAIPTLGQMQLSGWLGGLARAAYVGLPIAAFGYVAGLTLWLSRSGGWAQRALAPMGRMALTGYLASNLIGGLIWYGAGLGLLGRIGLGGSAAIGVVIFAGLVLFSHLWLARFSVGPVEGLWRRLSGKRSRPVDQAVTS